MKENGIRNLFFKVVSSRFCSEKIKLSFSFKKPKILYQFNSEQIMLSLFTEQGLPKNLIKTQKNDDNNQMKITNKLQIR